MRRKFPLASRADFLQRTRHEQLGRDPHEVDGRRFGGGLRHQVLGATTTSPSTTPATSRPTPAGLENGKIDLKELVDEVVAARHRPAAADPLLRRAQEPHRRAERGLPPRHRRVRLQGRVQGRLPDQGQPAPLRRRGDRPVRAAVPLRPRGRLEAGAAGGHGHARRRRGADHLQRLQGRGVHRDRAHGVEARAHGAHRRREVLRAAAHRRDREEDGRAAAHRHPRQAGGQGLGALGGVGRRPLEVRPVDARDGRGGQLPAPERPAELLRAAALPPRQPDLGDPRGQERAARGGALLRRGREAGRAAQVLRRGRRPRRRLRRLADQLRVVDELHDAGVRQRHRVRARRRSATRPRCRTRRSSPSRGARSSRTTRCW